MKQVRAFTLVEMLMVLAIIAVLVADAARLRQEGGTSEVDKAILDEVVQSALRKAYRWQTPRHWNTNQWREELVGVAYLAALQAGGEYDPARGIPLQPFLLQRTLSALLTFYRREWKFGSQCTPFEATSPEDDVSEVPP